MIQAKNISIALILTLFASACGKDESGGGNAISITKMKPPVKEAAGSALTASSALLVAKNARIFSVDADSIKSRFFSPGPTSLMAILGSLDQRLSEIETRSAESVHECLDAVPSDVTMTIFGETVTAKIQCVDDMGASGFIAFGKDGDEWWVIDAVGAAHTVAKATTLSDGNNEVEIWGGVGFTNSTWDGQSYGAYHVKANNSTNEFEMAAGGMSIGFCGVMVRSDGVNLYVEGSKEDGGPGACEGVSFACVLSTDLAGSGSCSSISSPTLGIIGRATATGSSITWSQSDWRSGSGISLNGNSNDDIHFVSLSDIPSSVGAF